MKKFLYCLTLLVFLAFPQITLADGMMIAPPYYRVLETGQKAVIWFDNNQETMILSTSFQGDAADFAWVIPVPAKPEVQKGSDEVFTSLEDLTQPVYRIQTLDTSGFGTMKAPAQEAVTVVETKKVDIYQVNVLTSTESKALATWLADNDYPYPVSQSHILDSYIENNWFFVAAKIDTEKLGASVQGQLKTGHAAPLMISFAANRIVYPLKISSITGDFYESDVFYQQGFNNHSSDGWATDGINTSLVYDSNNAFEGLNSIKLMAEKSQTEPRETAKIINELAKGKTYTFSAYLKAGRESTGSAQLNAGQGGLEISSQPVFLGNNWQRLILTFTAQAKSHRLAISGLNFSPGEYFFIDAIQLEPGAKATDFESKPQNQAFNTPLLEGETIPDSPGFKENRFIPEPMPLPYPETKQVGISLYVFDAKKKVEIPGFATEYAGWVKAKEIQNLAFNDRGDPLLPTKKKMYLTRLTRFMKPSEMTTDLYPRLSENNKSVGRGSSVSFNIPTVILVFSVPLLLEVAFIAWLFSRRRSK